MSTGFLAQMAASSAERVQQALRRVPREALRDAARAAPAAPPLTLSRAGFDLIAELKLRSPAAGRLASALDDVGGRVRVYAAAGAAAVSVLTEPERFDGSLEHLAQATQSLEPLGVPAMRKDFLIDPYQVLEARVAGAGGVLVIVRMLADEQVIALLDSARELGLFVLLETFDETDIARTHALLDQRSTPAGADAAGQLLVGVNSRDLATLEVVPGRLEALVDALPRSVPRVAESGVGSPADAARLARAGYDLALVGSALMRGSDPAGLAQEMLSAGRRAREGRR